MAIHKIELTASCTELCAAIGWYYKYQIETYKSLKFDYLIFRMISWYLTYTRTLGRGFTFDDPDTMAYIMTTTNTLIYFVYNIKINIHPEEYGTNQIYAYADILGFIGSVYYVFGTLRDDNWFWFLPLAGQYGIAPSRIQIETKDLPQFGVSPILITDLCIKRKRETIRKKSDPYISIKL